MAKHLAPIGLGRVAASRQYADIWKISLFHLKELPQFGQRAKQVTLNVIVESSERRDVENARSSDRQLSADQLVESP